MRRDALAILFGVTAIQFAPVLPAPGAGGVVTAIFALLLLWLARLRAALFIVLGLVYALGRAQLDAGHTLPANREPLEVRASIEIASLVERGSDSSAFDARVLFNDAGLPLRRVRIRWYRAPPSLHAAQLWTLALRLRCPRGFRNPGGFDLEGTYFRAGIDALASVSMSAAPRLDLDAAGSPVLRIREFVSSTFTGWVPGSPSAGVIAGLAVGDTSGIEPELWSVFRAVGITHLMAISGAHVGMFGMFAAIATRMIWRITRRRGSQRGSQGVCAVAAVLASFGYAMLAGFSIPSQRTALMIAVVGAARLRTRILSPSRVLSLALIAVLLLDPAAPMQAGFWLSFTTVAWIFCYAAGAAPMVHWRQEIAVQGGVSLLLLPITLYCFGQASLIAPLINLIAIPVSGLILVPLIILAAVAAPLAPSCAQWLIQAVAGWLDAVWPVLRDAGAWPLAQWWTPALPLVLAVTGAAAAMVVFLVPDWRWRCIAGGALLGVFLWRSTALQRHEFDVSILEAGDAVMSVLLTRDATLVYYIGAGGVGGADVGASVLLPYLRSRGRRRIDLLIFGRADGAYAAGLDSIFREMPVAQLIGGADSQAPCMAGQRFDRDGVAIRVLGPADSRSVGREASCVLWAGNGHASVLIPGDITQAVENSLVESGAAWPATLVIVPARGSQSASGEGFIEAVRPRWAVVAAAHLNRFGYPRAAILARWEAVGAQVREVSREGAMTLRARADGSIDLPPGERLTNRRYWSAK